MAVSPYDPYGLAFGPQRPDPGPDTHPGGHVLAALAHHLYNSLTPRTNEPEGAPEGQNLHQYLSSTARAFDPRTAAGLGQLATILFPGGRGRGGLTPMQKMYMDQLGNVGGGKTISGRNISQEGVEAKSPFFIKQPLENPLSQADVNANPGLRAIAEAFGHSYGTPLPELLLNTAHNPESALHRVGVTADTGGWEMHPGDMRSLSQFSPHADLIKNLLARSAINRRN